MNKNLIERPKKFNQREYNDQYQKEHYISISARVKPDVANRINNYCADNGISKSEFLKRAIEMLESQ